MHTFSYDNCVYVHIYLINTTFISYVAEINTYFLTEVTIYFLEKFCAISIFLCIAYLFFEGKKGIGHSWQCLQITPGSVLRTQTWKH